MADTPTQSSYLDNIVADTNAALVQSSSNEAAVVANIGKLENTSASLVELQNQRASDAALLTQTATAADLKAQQYRLKAANAAGIDPTKASDFMLEQIGRFQQGVRRRDAAYDDWEKKKSSKLLDDPVQWITDLVSLPEANRQINFAEGQVQRAGQNIVAINNVVQSVASTSMQIKESTTAAAADAATRIAANEAQQAALRTSMESVKYNTAALEASMNATKDRLALQYNLTSAKNQAFNQQMVLERFAQEKLEFDWRKDEKRAMNAAKESGKEIDVYVEEMIEVGRRVRGLPPLSGTAMKTSVQLFKSGASKELALDFKNGEHTIQTGNAMLASTPAEALDTYKNYTVADIPARSRALSVLNAAENALASNPVMAGSKDENAKAKFINDFVAKEVAAQYASGSKSPDNMFNVGDISGYLTMGAIANLPVTKKLLIPATESGAKMDDPKVVLDLAIAAVRKKVITSNDFADLATVYQLANDLNLRASNPLGLGIQIPNGGRNYFVKVQTFGAPLDVTNSQELLRYMNKQAAAQLGMKQTEDARTKYGTPGSPNAMRRMMQDQMPVDPDELKGK